MIPGVSIHHGDCREFMAGLDDANFDAIVTDPPYELGFMGKGWDRSGIAYDVAVWGQALRVLKPGAHLVAFGGSRTYHRLACAIEDAGFEIRDQLQWLYGSGFPKSLNIGDGWGTALKPAHEPIVLARKPLIGPVAANVAGHGTGALNVDGCRIETAEVGALRSDRRKNREHWRISGGSTGSGDDAPLGRWPANVILDEEAGALLDAQSGERKSGKLEPHHKRYSARLGNNTYGDDSGGELATNGASYGGDVGGASRFFYCAKASRSERNAGLEEMPERPSGVMQDDSYKWTHDGKGNAINLNTRSANHHPTVKPISLMRWLCRLITPPGGLILDPFLGSGSTGCAAVLEGFRFIGCDLDAEYVEIARRRIAHHGRQTVLAIA